MNKLILKKSFAGKGELSLIDNLIKNMRLSSTTFKLSVYLLILVLYLISFLFKLNFGMYIFSMPFLLYLPGALIIETFPILKFNSGKFGKLSLIILYSFCIVAVLGLLVQNYYGFDTDLQVLSIAVFNIIMFLICIFLVRNKWWRHANIKYKTIFYEISWRDLIPLIIMAGAIFVTIYLNPIAQDADNYLSLLKQSIVSNFNNLTSRYIFISFIELYIKSSQANIYIIFRNIYIILFFSQTLIFYDYLKKNFSSNLIISLLYLSLLTPSVIITELNIIRPQVVILSLTLPTIILSLESVKTNNLHMSIATLGISIIAMKFHELSIVLLIVALGAIMINIARLIIIEKKKIWKNVLLFIIIIYPYCKIFNSSIILGKTVPLAIYAISFFTKINWRWWFINNYTTIDGFNLGWTGFNILLYYLYNGALLLTLLVSLYLFILVKKIRIGLYFVLPFIYFIIFFSFAEIIPRLGLYFLPNRAWVHLMLVSVVILALLVELIEKHKTNIKYLPMVLIILPMIGLVGSIYVANNNINQVYKEELPVANFIRYHLSNNSVIISSQDNYTLVNLYGTKHYGRIDPDKIINKNEFSQLIQEELQNLSQEKIIIIKPKTIQINETLINDQIIERKENISPQVTQLYEATYKNNNPVYFLYSFRKLKGFNTKREYKKTIIDQKNVDTYGSFGYEIIYSDENAILYRIQ